MSKQLIDFDHFRRYTGGDTAIEREILSVFVNQVDIWLRALQDSGDVEMWRDVAHTLKGASRGIGAWRIGDVCERAEKLIENSTPAERSIALGDLRSAINDTVQFIDEYLSKSAA